MSRLPLSLAVVGVRYPNKRGPTRRFEMMICEPGEPVELRPEPKNPEDPNAIAVYSARGVQLGYLTAERAPWIGGMLKSGIEVRAVFQRMDSASGVIRVSFDGTDPVVPPAPPKRLESDDDVVDEDHGWHPDEEWPEV